MVRSFLAAACLLAATQLPLLADEQRTPQGGAEPQSHATVEVPEPSSFVLIGLASMLVIFRKRRSVYY